MIILHTFLALAAGFAVVLLLGAALTALVARFTPSWVISAAKPEDNGQPARYAFGAVLVHLGAIFLAAAAGGYVTAWITNETANGSAHGTAAANPLVQILALAMIVLVLGALNALQSRGKLPIWLQLIPVALSPLGVLAGGLVRLRAVGIL